MVAQTELQKLKSFIGDRLTQLDRKVDTKIDEVKFDVKEIDKKLSDLDYYSDFNNFVRISDKAIA